MKIGASKLVLGMLILVGTSTLNVEAAVAKGSGTLSAGNAVYSGAGMGTDKLDVVGNDTVVNVITEVGGIDGLTYRVIRYKDKFGFVPYHSMYCDEYLDIERIDSSTIETLPEICLDGSIYKNAYDELLSRYELIPKEIREAYRNSGFKIIMSGDDITDRAYAPYGGYKYTGSLISNNRIAACFDYETKTLWLNDEYPRNITHEMGHYVNDVYGYTKDKIWDKLFKTEAVKVSRYATDKKTEYFAEVFDLYVRDPEMLKTLSLASYTAMECCVNDFINRVKLEGLIS